MILVNLKIYKETFGNRALELAKICKQVADKYNLRVVVAASALDAVRIKNEIGVETWLQNVDVYVEGKHSGYVSSAQAMALGIDGSLINHFEHQSPRGMVYSILASRPMGFEVMCAAKTVGQIERWIYKAKPDFIMYEPPELIGSSQESVASRPKSIEGAVKVSKEIPLIVGAGVKSREDVEISLKMGASGVGLASNFVKSTDPMGMLSKIAEGFSV